MFKSSGDLILIPTNNNTTQTSPEEIELVNRNRPHTDSEEYFLDDHKVPSQNDNDNDTIKLLQTHKKITTYTEYFFKFGLHICIHITFLSILEPILFFTYIIVIEKKRFFDQFKHFVENIDPLFSSKNEEIRSQLFYDLAIQSFKNENISADEYFADLRITAQQDKLLTEQRNSHLEHQAFLFFFILLSFTSVYYAIFQYYYRRKLFIVKILMKHIGLMVFIGIYEIWFFLTVILKYKPWSESEITYYLMQCFASHLYQYYPELKFSLQNETISC
jgi:hypothetical protein